MKILIADDEIQIRTGLTEGIPWKTLGFDEIYTAENGIQALSLGKQHRPEIIITDIQMPGMTGLELGNEIKKLYEPAEVIILSGYSEFEYAREAITMRAFDYLLKPIRIKELIERVKQARERVEQFHADSENKNRFQALNRTRLLQQMIMSKGLLSSREEEIFLEQMQMTFPEFILVGVCSVDTLMEKELKLLGSYLEDQLQAILVRYKGEELYWERGNLFFVMSLMSNHDKERKMTALKKDIQGFNEKLQGEYQNSVSLAISDLGRIREVALLFRQAESALKKRLYRGKKSFLEPEDRDENPKLTLNPIDVTEMQNRMESFDHEHICLYLHAVFQELKEKKVTSIDLVKSMCEQLKNILLQTLLDKGIDLKGICEQNQALLKGLPDYSTLEEYEGWITDLYMLVLQGLTRLSGGQHSRVILQAVDYISQNYANNINLEMTATYVNKSKNYFSYLFKKELGISFIEYLNQVRIDKAKKLLDTTDDRTYEISEAVGYSDYKYFSSVFKKLTGVSPAQYKKRSKS